MSGPVKIFNNVDVAARESAWATIPDRGGFLIQSAWTGLNAVNGTVLVYVSQDMRMKTLLATINLDRASGMYSQNFSGFYRYVMQEIVPGSVTAGKYTSFI